MNANDAGCSRCDHLLYPFGIKRVSLRVDIAKNWRNVLPLNSMSGSNGGERRQNDFAGDAQSTDSNLQTCGRIAHGNAVFGAYEIGYALLKLVNVDPSVGEPRSSENIANALQELPPMPNVRTTHVQSVFKCRPASKER